MSPPDRFKREFSARQREARAARASNRFGRDGSPASAHGRPNALIAQRAARRKVP
jgi:hypothetical protein